MDTISSALCGLIARRVPLLALVAALLGTGCGSSSTSLVAPTTQKCQISVTGFTGTFGPSGGSGTATIDAARECSWSAASGASWITVASPGSGTGAGTLSFSVQPNIVPRARNGSLAVNAEQLTVSQAPAPCQFGVSPTNVSVAAAGGTVSVTVSANDGSCAWSATSQSPWISVSGAGANGSGAVSLTVAANTGPARSGSLSVAGQTVTVSQPAVTPGPPSPTPGPPPPTPTPGPTTSIELTGDVSGRRGDCPTLSFFVQGIAVVTNADTVFVNTQCNKVKNGLHVQVDGVQQAGQPVVATRVTNLN